MAKASEGPEEMWPPSPVRGAIERVGRSELDDGFVVQILNSRGVQSRGVGEDGRRERERASHYRRLADAITDESPRTAAALMRVVASYEHDATRFDEQAQRFAEGLDL